MALVGREIPSLTEVTDFVKSHRILVGSAAAVGLTLYGIRRYCAGGRCKSKARLDGKTVIITGSNTGIGKETAVDLARRGAKVILACRDEIKAERAAQDIRKRSGNDNIIVQELDLASLDSVRRFSRQVKNSEHRLHILINNAGLMACPQSRTEDGFEMQFGTNHLGHFLLTHELLDLLKASAPSRVVTLSSNAHTGVKFINFDDLNMENGYDGFKAYCQSKLANVLFSRELHKKLQGTGVTTYTLHPGVINTEIMRHLPVWLSFMVYFFKLTLKSLTEGAQTTIYCAVQEGIEKDSGKYFSDCAVKKPDPQGEDDAAARRLWDVSEQLVGIKPKA